jgi:hypothetical protein
MPIQSLKQTIYATLVTTILLLPVTGQAATYYVAPTGNDASTCTQAKSASTPKKTIPAGVKCLAGGDTLIVKAGTYINQEITNPPAGTASAYTVIKGDPSGARPVIKPNRAAAQRGFYCSRGETCRYIEMRYFEVVGAYNSYKLDGTPTIGYGHHMRIIGNIFHDSNGAHIITSTSNTGFLGGDHLIQGNEFYRTGVYDPGYKPGHNTIYNPGNRTIVEHNRFHNLAHGVGIWTKDKLIQNVIVRNNVFYDIGRTNTDTWQRGANNYNAVHVSVSGGGHKIYNNIIYRSGDEPSFSGIVVGGSSGSDTNRISNNTIYDIKNSNAHAVRITTTTGTNYVRNNITYLAGRGIAGGSQSNNLKTNPSFRDASRGNFTLLSGSAAVDKGLILSEVPTDFAGARRPAGSSHDIGAYEVGATSTLAAPTSLSGQ